MVISHAIRKSRMWGKFSLLLVLALLLPVLLGLLPPLSSSAAVAFERDLAASLCISGEDGRLPPTHGDHEQCCILCPAGPPIASVLDASTSIPLPDLTAVLHDFTAEAVTGTPAGENWHSARGPPAT